MKTSNENFEAFVLPLDQLYAISGGNDGEGECDPVKCDAYDAGRWFGESLIFIGKIAGLLGLAKGIKKSK